LADFASARSAIGSKWRDTPFDVFLTPTLTQLPRPVGYCDMNEPDFDKYIGKWSEARSSRTGRGLIG